MNKIKYLFLVLIFLVISTFCFLSFKRVSKNSKIENKFLQLPNIGLLNENGVEIQASDFGYDEIKVLIYFNTHCDFCQFELDEIKKRLFEFGETQILMFSVEPIDSILTLKQQFANNSNVGVYRCKYKQLIQHFGDISSPSTFIYNPNGKLLKHFKGATRIDDILDVIYDAKNSIEE